MIAISEAEQNAVLRMENRNLRDANKHLQGELIRARARTVTPELLDLLCTVACVVEDHRDDPEDHIDANLAELVVCWDAWSGPRIETPIRAAAPPSAGSRVAPPAGAIGVASAGKSGPSTEERPPVRSGAAPGPSP